MITDLTDTKIKIANEEESEKVQLKAFELGKMWGNHPATKVRKMHGGIGSLYFRGGIITFMSKGYNDFYKKTELKTITLQDLFEPDIKFKLVKRAR